MTKKWNIVTWGAVVLSTISFWSTGVLLIRTLNGYGVWDNDIFVVMVFGLSIPLAFISIAGVRRLFVAMQRDTSVIVSTISGSVLLAHAVALEFFPYLYLFEGSTALSAAGWLLWFGGIVALVI